MKESTGHNDNLGGRSPSTRQQGTVQSQSNLLGLGFKTDTATKPRVMGGDRVYVQQDNPILVGIIDLSYLHAA